MSKCPFAVPAFPVLVLGLELLVAIQPVAQVSSPFLDMCSIVVPLVVKTIFLWTCVAIINSPDCRNYLFKLLADSFI
jgi:hypothetical protein